MAQYISNRDEGCSLGQHFRALGSHDDDHKILKALPRCKRLGRGHIALFGFIFFVDLLDLAAIDAQAPLGHQGASQALQQALSAPVLQRWCLLASLISHGLAQLKARLSKTQAIMIEVSL